MANEMLLSTAFIDAQEKDFSPAFAVANPAKSATLTNILEQKGVISVSNTVVQKRVKTLSKTGTSGGKVEGAKAGDAELSAYTTLTNNTEIFSKVVEISRTALKMHTTSANEEIADRIDEMKEDGNHEVLFGEKALDPARRMDGLVTVAKHKITLDGAVMTEEELDAAIQKMNTTGNVFLAVNPADMFKVQRTLLGDKTAINMATSETSAGVCITEYQSAQGVKIRLYADTDLTAGSYLLYDMDKVEYYEFDSPKVEALAKEGDSERAMVVTEFTIIAYPDSIVYMTKNAG